MRKNWPYPPTASGSYGREGGRPADEIRVDFKILKLIYRFNYSEFNLFNIIAILLQYYNCIQSPFVKLKFILRCVLKCKIFGSHFLCQSLLLGTNVPNDNSISTIIHM